jgi:hypothetical protein
MISPTPFSQVAYIPQGNSLDGLPTLSASVIRLLPLLFAFRKTLNAGSDSILVDYFLQHSGPVPTIFLSESAQKTYSEADGMELAQRLVFSV